MRNCKELRTQLSQVFTAFKAGKITYKEAAGYANIAGKMISSAKVQVDYNNSMKNPKRVDFLEE